MSPKDLRSYRLTLSEVIKNCDCRLRPGAEVISSPDLDEQAADHHNQYVTVVNKEIRWRICDAAHRALDRLEEGEFGRCEECGELINPKRLAAVPWAELCTECQARQETARQLELAA